MLVCLLFFFFSSRRRHTRCSRDWSSDVCSSDLFPAGEARNARRDESVDVAAFQELGDGRALGGIFQVHTGRKLDRDLDRKSTRLNSSHGYISYAVFCLKKKKKKKSLKHTTSAHT